MHENVGLLLTLQLGAVRHEHICRIVLAFGKVGASFFPTKRQIILSFCWPLVTVAICFAIEVQSCDVKCTRLSASDPTAVNTITTLTTAVSTINAFIFSFSNHVTGHTVVGNACA